MILPKVRACFLALAACAALGTAHAADFKSGGDPKALAKTLLESMPDEHVVGQLFMIAYTGSEPSELVFRWIRERGLGGIKIFGWNTDVMEQVIRSVGSMQAASVSSRQKIPLFVATDQEGGWIRHVKGRTTETPGNMAIGASDVPYDAFMTGKYIGRELAALGINMNFAPTVDIATDIDSRIIGSRAFSQDPMKTALLGTAFFKGMDGEGVICTAKHYPGHGDTPLDSHGTLPVVNADLKTAWDRELVPYRTLVKEGIPAIMSGHLAFPKISGDSLPASLSPYLLKTLLREKIGFKGLIITDDLYMGGATQVTGSVSESVLRALRAGNDIVMMSRTPEFSDPVWTRTMDAYRSDPEFRKQVRSSVLRILETKLRFLDRKDAITLTPTAADALKRVPDPEGQKFFLAQACRSVSWLKKGELPIRRGTEGRVLLAGQFQDFFDSGRATFPGASIVWLSYLPWEDPIPSERDALLAAAKNADTVILCVPSPSARKILDALIPLGKKTFAVSVLTPSPMRGAGDVSGSIAVYSYSPFSFQAAFFALTGAIEPTGVIPVKLDS